MSRRSSLERLPLAVRAAAAAAIGDGRRLARQMPPIAAKMLLYAVIYRYIPLYTAIYRYMSLYPAISRLNIVLARLSARRHGWRP